MFKFTVIASNEKGRVCKIETPHGFFFTPSFYFCATHGAIRNLDINNVSNEGTTNILSNTYSLMNYADLIQKHGGIHNFIGWNGVMLTDSGGYQAFSMGHGSVSNEIKGVRNRKSFVESITEEGCMFICPVTGDKKLLSPEISMEIQYKIGADFVVAFDECTPFHSSYNYTKHSMERSHRWEKRSLEKFQSLHCENQRIYGIVQGGIYDDLRTESCDFVNNNDFWGVCIGGSLGKDKEQMAYITKFSMERVNSRHRPVHLLGIGDIDDIERLVPLGIDTFDCVSPTRLARHGIALIKNLTSGHHKINLKNSVFREDNNPIDISCLCFTCRNHSRSYIHYLIKRKVLLYGTLLAIHNMRQMNNLMANIRENILRG